MEYLTADQESIVGPVIALAAHNAALEDFITYPQWDRAIGARRTSYLTIDAQDSDKATRDFDRRSFLTSQLRSLMSRDGFIGFEHDLEQMLGS